jgi:hypothetical protein
MCLYTYFVLVCIYIYRKSKHIYIYVHIHIYAPPYVRDDDKKREAICMYMYV